jgi:putative DNA primase/helicase
MDIETFLAAGGLKVKAGQLVRLLNIPMEKSTVFNGQPNGKTHADALKEAWIDNHGAAGVSGLNGWQPTSRRLNRRCVTRRRGGASFRLTMVSRYTAWQNALPFLKRL